MEKNRRQALLSWLYVSALFVLCGVLGVLQYRSIGAVSVAERERLHSSLQMSLNRLSQDFDSEIRTACRALAPFDLEGDTQAGDQLAARYALWKRTGRHSQLFRRIGLVGMHNGIRLQILNLETGTLESAAWPEGWQEIQRRMEFMRSPEPWRNREPPARPPGDPGTLVEMPVFRVPRMGLRNPRPGAPPFMFSRGGPEWVIFEIDPAYARDTLLPELVQRHLGAGGSLEYQVEVVSAAPGGSVIYASEDVPGQQIVNRADASVSLFARQFDLRWRGPGMGGSEPPRMPRLEPGRWQMFVRHRSGSLDAVVSKARWRSLAVTAGILLLMLAAVAALIRFTRHAQKLAELQLDFVAGVSHELRTPLTVIHTAAYNLRGKLAGNPAQVERYGALIQEESGRLKALVEQVLQFSTARAGQAIRAPQPLSVEAVIEDTLRSSAAYVDPSRFVVEKSIAPGLPSVLGDRVALQHALENLLSNAAKYGTGGSNWIGVSASETGNKEHPQVEIRVADHGPGIPEDEQKHIFEPFFRGRRAKQDQVHGTGLGLNLVKRIVEAHGGNIRVKSEPMKGAEFIVRIPAVPAGA